MPVTVRMNHAIADGYLIANVFRLLQKEIDVFGQSDFLPEAIGSPPVDSSPTPAFPHLGQFLPRTPQKIGENSESE